MTSVLVVDDSAFVREVVGTALAERGYEVGTASDGRAAVDLVERCRPDAVVMDVEMPEMDGVEATERIMTTDPTPVVVLSAHADPGSDAAMAALARGALEVIQKGEDPSALVDRVADAVSRAVRTDLAGAAIEPPARPASGAWRTSERPAPPVGAGDGPDPDPDGSNGRGAESGDGDGGGSPGGFTDATPEDPVREDGTAVTAGSEAADGSRARADGATTVDVPGDGGWPAAGRSPDEVETPAFEPPDRADFRPTVVIGASTGGPETVETVLAGLPPELAARVLVVQHMPEAFTGRLAEHLDGVSGYAVSEAEDGDVVGPGEALVARGDHHLRVARRVGDGLRVSLDRDERVHSVRPAVDVTMESAAENATEPLVGVVLTGMGRDGAAGVEAVAAAGGVALAQDPASSSVPGMPEQAVATGAVDRTPAPEAIPRAICETLQQ